MELFEARVRLACPAERVFDLVSRPDGIRQISPPDMGLHFVEAGECYSSGMRVTFQVQTLGMIKTIVHEICDFRRPEFFSERQVDGPFQHWVHEHLFEECEGGVEVIDRISFEPPGGIVGLMMNAARLREHLEEGFDYRHEQLERLFGQL